MRKLCIGLTAAALSLGVNAGKVSFTGEGVSERKPEFVQVSITVQSECYKTPEEAGQANKAQVSELQSYLTTLLVESPFDKVSTQGGVSQPFSRVRYVGPDREEVVECKNTYQKTTTLTFTTSNIENDNFSTTYDLLLTRGLSSFSSAGEGGEEARTYVNIAEPHAAVSSETRRIMQLEALELGEKAARAQFDVVAKLWGIEGNVEITHESDNEPSYHPKSVAYELAAAPRGFGRTPAVKLDFEPIREYSSRPITFIYPSCTFKACPDHQ